MVKRRLIRLGVTYNRTNYFVDNGVQRGATYEYAKLFEDRLNTVLKTGNLRIHVMCIPLPSDRLLTALTEGRVDIVDGQLTITPERHSVVDFGVPTRRNVREGATFEWLERAYAVRDVHLIFLTVDVKWDRYRADPRFGDLLARCGFTTIGTRAGKGIER
jgi:hypothetical protein